MNKELLAKIDEMAWITAAGEYLTVRIRSSEQLDDKEFVLGKALWSMEYCNYDQIMGSISVLQYVIKEDMINAVKLYKELGDE